MSLRNLEGTFSRVIRIRPGQSSSGTIFISLVAGTGYWLLELEIGFLLQLVHLIFSGHFW